MTQTEKDQMFRIIRSVEVMMRQAYELGGTEREALIYTAVLLLETLKRDFNQ